MFGADKGLVFVCPIIKGDEDIPQFFAEIVPHYRGEDEKKRDKREEGNNKGVDVDNAVGNTQVFDEVLTSADAVVGLGKRRAPHVC